ncbi:MAG: GspE/PulE family protein, partial [Clostridium sp.]
MNFNEIFNELDLNVVRKFNKDKILEMKALPIMIQNNNLIVLKATEEVLDGKYLNFYFSLDIKWVKVEESILNEVIDGIYIYENDNMEELLIEKAIKKRVSDIHFEPFEEKVNIRFRMNGDLILMAILKKDEYQGVLSKIKLLSNIDIAKRRLPHDGKLLFKFGEKNYDCRVSTVPVVYGEKLVIRVLFSDSNFLDIKELNFSKENLLEIYKMIRVKNGLVIVNGSTGSGKSTTLYSIISSLNKKIQNITTVEDPVEMFIEGVNQISIDRSVNFNFSKALRSVLRQDLDILMVGEVRDEETAEIAVRSALTGHKIYATIHTKSPYEVYTRLEEMGVENYLIRDSIIGIISQRLIKILCPKCKEKIQEKIYDFDTFRAKGCNC